MKRITKYSDITIPEKQYCPYQDFALELDSISNYNNLFSYDFPDIHIAKLCRVYENGIVIFYKSYTKNDNGTYKVDKNDFYSAYSLFDESKQTINYSSLQPDFSYINSLTSCRNNPLHYHIIPVNINSSGELTFTKNYEFTKDSKYYFTADFDGSTNESLFTCDAENGFYCDDEKDGTEITSFYFKDPTSTVRIKCNKEIKSYEINNIEIGGENKIPELTTFSKDYITGFTLSDIYINADSGTAILEVWS